MHRTPVTLDPTSLQSHIKLRILEKLVTQCRSQLLALCFTIPNLVQIYTNTTSSATSHRAWVQSNITCFCPSFKCVESELVSAAQTLKL